MKPRSLAGRRFADRLVKGVSGASALIGLLALVWILYEVIIRGASALNLDFFTKLPTPPGAGGGGLANAIVGTLVMTAIATAVGVPIGLCTGVYLSEFGRRTKFATLVRFVVNALMGAPSIIIGLFVYALLVIPMRSFSGLAGGLALAIIMIPVVARTSEDVLNLVPNALRESALALGVPRWKTTLTIVFRAARRGLLTGILLAVARVSGETAPLLFTALNSRFWTESLFQPAANLTVTIFNYAMSPYEDWWRMAWGASLLITGGVLVLTVSARFLLRERRLRGRT